MYQRLSGAKYQADTKQSTNSIAGLYEMWSLCGNLSTKCGNDDRL